MSWVYMRTIGWNERLELEVPEVSETFDGPGLKFLSFSTLLVLLAPPELDPYRTPQCRSPAPWVVWQS